MKKFCTLVSVLTLALFSNAQVKTIKEALTQNDTLTVLQLIKGGSDINEYDAVMGTDYLMRACRYENDPVKVAFLLRHGANPEKNKSPQGRSALHVAAAYYGCLNTIQLLVEHGANVNGKSKDGSTPLMLAALNAKADVVEYLLSKGARSDAKDLSGKTALDYAMMSKDDDDTKTWLKCNVDKKATIKVLQK